MYGGEDVFAYHAFVEHDCVLIVVTFPRHECNLEVASECELAVFGRVAFGEDGAVGDTLTFFTYRTKVNGGALVGFAEFGDVVFLDSIFESNEFFVFGAVVADAYHCGIDKFNHAVALCCNLCA